MKTHIILLGIIIFSAFSIQAKTIITNSGNSFSPANVTINLGDTIQFALSQAHDAVEVSQATYTAKGNTSNGGFSVPFGGGTVVFKNAGTFYYVCTPHAAFGMRGIITVNNVSSLLKSPFSNNDSGIEINVFPNPTSKLINVEFNLDSSALVSISLIDDHGQLIKNLQSSKYATGTYVEQYLLPNIQNGFFIVCVCINDKRVFRKIIIN